jgi:hypothetical protein
LFKLVRLVDPSITSPNRRRKLTLLIPDKIKSFHFLQVRSPVHPADGGGDKEHGERVFGVFVRSGAGRNLDLVFEDSTVLYIPSLATSRWESEEAAGFPDELPG